MVEKYTSLHLHIFKLIGRRESATCRSPTFASKLTFNLRRRDLYMCDSDSLLEKYVTHPCTCVWVGVCAHARARVCVLTKGEISPFFFDGPTFGTTVPSTVDVLTRERGVKTSFWKVSDV